MPAYLESDRSRPLFMISCTGMLVSYILITALSGSFATTNHKATGLAIIPMLFLYYGFYDIAFTPLFVSYTTEIWPYFLRARGLAVLGMTTQTAVFFNIFVNPIALKAISWKYYILYVVLLVIITAICYFTYPETRGYTLEDMARIYDKETVSKPRHDSAVQYIAEDMDGDNRLAAGSDQYDSPGEKREGKSEV
jgi:MFS family permease